MSEIACISFDAFSQYLSERYAMVTQYLFNLFVWYAVLIYFYMELVEYCDAIHIKIKWLSMTSSEFSFLLSSGIFRKLLKKSPPNPEDYPPTIGITPKP